jgi:hypothetical protein
VSLRPRPDALIRRVRELAAETQNVKWSRHARDRMIERGISIRVALTVLRNGNLGDDISPGENEGEWRAKVVRRVRGRREAGVVVIVQHMRLFVKTVEWEDVK